MARWDGSIYNNKRTVNDSLSVFDCYCLNMSMYLSL